MLFFKILSLSLLLSLPAYANKPIGRIIFLRGKVQKLLENTNIFQYAKKGDLVFNKTKYKTEKRSVVKIKLNDGSQLLISPNSEAVVTYFQKDQLNVTTMLKGKIRAYLKKKPNKDNKHRAIIKTKNVALGVRGTEFLFAISAKSKNIQAVTFEGVVDIAKTNGSGLNSIVSDLVNKSVQIKPGQRSIFNAATGVLSAPAMLPKGLFLKLAKLNPFSLKNDYEKEYQSSSDDDSSENSAEKKEKTKEPPKDEKKEKLEEEKTKEEESKEKTSENDRKEKTKKWYTKLSSSLVSKSHEYSQDGTNIRDKFDGTGVFLAIDFKRNFGRFFDAHIGVGRTLISYGQPENVQSNGEPPGNYSFFNIGFSINLTKNFSLLVDSQSEGEIGIRFGSNQQLDFPHIGVGKFLIGFRYKLFTLFNMPLHIQYQKMNMGQTEYESIEYGDGSGNKVGLTTIGATSTGFNVSIFHQDESQESNVTSSSIVREKRNKTSLELAYIF